MPENEKPAETSVAESLQSESFPTVALGGKSKKRR